MLSRRWHWLAALLGEGKAGLEVHIYLYLGTSDLNLQALNLSIALKTTKAPVNLPRYQDAINV